MDGRLPFGVGLRRCVAMTFRREPYALLVAISVDWTVMMRHQVGLGEARGGRSIGMCDMSLVC